MAALPAKEEAVDEGAMEVDAPAKEDVEGKAKAVPKEKELKGGQGQGQHKGGEKGGGGGGGGKKKKGKK